MELYTTWIIFSILISFFCQLVRGVSSSISPSDGNVLEGQIVALSCSFTIGQYTNPHWQIDHITSDEGFLLEGKGSYEVSENLYFTDLSEHGMYEVSYTASSENEFSRLIITNVTVADGMYRFACVETSDHQETVIGR